MPNSSGRASLLASDFTLVGGAYDGLTAMLVARAGFDAVWASGFCISASKCIPDSNELTVRDLVERVAEMTRVVSIPVIVDCDEGYGSLPNTRDLAKQLAACGAAGICIEDSLHPKFNSFYGEPGRALADVMSYSEKVRAIRAVAPELALIARTESLIAGESLEDALARGVRYAEAGADFVLIHSRYSELGEFRAVRKAWQESVPLVVIPTVAQNVSWYDLLKEGFRMVIYANQALRAGVQAQEIALRAICSPSPAATAEPALVTMEHIFSLTNLQDPRLLGK